MNNGIEAGRTYSVDIVTSAIKKSLGGAPVLGCSRHNLLHTISMCYDKNLNVRIPLSSFVELYIDARRLTPFSPPNRFLTALPRARPALPPTFSSPCPPSPTSCKKSLHLFLKAAVRSPLGNSKTKTWHKHSSSLVHIS
jgi:hypothetical protein